MTNMVLVFKALGDPIRLEIVRMLAGRELCVCDILDAFKVSQPTVSHHLRVLKYAGLVEDNREGKWIYYRLATEAIQNVRLFIDEINKDAGKAERVRTCK